MRAIWKGTISFGLVNIPVALGVATQRSDPKFRTLDRETLQPIRQQLFSPARGKTIDREETVKGYEIAKDRFVTLTDEELESVAVQRRRTIDIVAFVNAEEVDPVYFDRTYYLQPQEAAEKPYALLVQAMKETGKAALGKIVLSSREHLALLRPSGDALAIELLFYPEDVRPKDDIEDEVRDAEVREQELAMARQLIDSLTRPFEPAEFENEHKQEVLALVERKVAGEEIAIAPEAPAPAAVPDLMSALKASIEQAKDRTEGDGSQAEASEERAGANGASGAKRSGRGKGRPRAPKGAGKSGSRGAKAGAGSKSD